MAGRKKLETILLENGLASEEQLRQITSYAQAVGIDLYEAVLQKKIAPPDAVMIAYAESIGLPFIHLSDVSLDEDIIDHIDPITARQYSFIPISVDRGHVLLATTKPVLPDVEEELRMRFNLPVRCAICTPAELNAAIARYYPRGTSQIIKVERDTTSKPRRVTPKPKPVEPMDDEEKRDRLLKTIVAFNFTVAFVCFALYYMQIPRGIHNTWYHLPLLALLGAAVGGIVAFITWKRLSR